MKKVHLIFFPLLIVSYEMATYLATDMYLPALPQMEEQFHISQHLVQLTLTAWFLGSASLQLIMGPLSDRYGRRPVLLWGGLFFLISTMICASTSNINVFLIARFIQGTAVCSAIVAGYASIHELLEHKRAIQTLAWMNSITVLAPAVGPLLGALLLEFSSWRIIFWFLAAWGLIVLSLLFKDMPESNPNGKTQHPIHFKTLAKNYGLILSNKQFALHNLIFCLLFGGIIAWLTAGTFLVVTEFHYSVMQFTFFQCLIFGAFILGSRSVKTLIEKINAHRLINMGLILTLVGGVTAVLATWLMPTHILSLILPLVIFGAGAGLSFSPLSRVTIESAPQPMGAKMAIFSGGISISGALGSTLVTIFYDGQSSSLAALIATLTIVACGCKWLALRNPSKTAN